MKHAQPSSPRTVLLLVLALTLIFTAASLTTSSAAASRALAPEQKDKDKDKDKGKKNKKNKKENAKEPSAAPTTVGKPALWEDRGDISALDLFYGIGSEGGMPKPPFQFKEEDTTGTNP